MMIVPALLKLGPEKEYVGADLSFDASSTIKPLLIRLLLKVTDIPGLGETTLVSPTKIWPLFKTLLFHLLTFWPLALSYARYIPLVTSSSGVGSHRACPVVREFALKVVVLVSAQVVVTNSRIIEESRILKTNGLLEIWTS